ncbi:aldehyde dehydrogenase family protein [Granulicoccus phenolivorans]|uniref:aldehyde dehydrogenase family protein n=1 Tax=Granulicoccus phenolivorans TaxID=266854 RepID=UPI0004158231|nr:aldehyde dehydrogenase family protein [Granulicoccus phenolivorans]
MTTVEREFITGADLAIEGRVEVYNPANTDEIVGTMPRIRPEHVDAVVRAAHAAQKSWARSTPQERFEAIIAALDAAGKAGDAARVLTAENGKVLADSERELLYMSYPVKFLAGQVDWLTQGEDLGESPTHRTRVFRNPMGVVAVLTPWNVPIGMSVITLAPALLAGNSVVAHLPSTCPLATLQVFGALAKALPPGVLSLISSPDTNVAKTLVEHPLTRGVHFTGSSTVGSLIMHEASDTLSSVTLELGGNDAAIMLDDAFDDDAVYGKLVAAAFPFAGQACVALKRLYVPQAKVEPVREAIGSILAKTVVGNGLDAGVTMGPLHTAAGKANVERLVRSVNATANGKVYEYGELAGDPAKGHFLLPTLATGVHNGDAIVDNEQFGPTLPIIGYDSVEQAVEFANDSEVGLGGSVWSADEERATEVARGIETGMVWINGHAGQSLDGRAPWGGVKLTGVGRGGANRYGLEGFTEAQAITIKK